MITNLKISRFIASENTTIDDGYFAALAADKDLGQTRGIDATLKMFNLDALLLPTAGASGPAAIAGYPIVTGVSFLLHLNDCLDSIIACSLVPLGFQPPNMTLAPAQPTRSMGPNMPFGVSFMGTAFSEFSLISYAFAYEQATHTRLKQLAFPDAIPQTQIQDVVQV